MQTQGKTASNHATTVSRISFVSRFLLLCLLNLGVFVHLHPVYSQATSADQRLAAWKHHVHLEETSPYRHLQWQPLGPTRQGGRIETLACDGSTIYVGAGSGNLWKSTNNGITWTPVFEKESAFAIGDVTLAPSNSQIVWVGTGETQPRHSGYSYSGTGVFKSLDAGQTWQHVGLSDTHHIGKVVIHPTDPDTVYVAAIGHAWTENTERGLFKTTDGGKTWKHVLAINDQTGVVDLAMDPTDPQILYAAAWQKTRYKMAGPQSGLYKSVDGGENWTRLAGGLPESTDLGRSGVTVSASNPNVVYAFIDNHSPDGDRTVGGQVYRSDDKGETWTRTNQESLYGVYKQYGWKFADIHVVPNNEDELFILGNRVYYSSDAGKTFDPIPEKIVRLHPHKTKAMHLDHHDMWIDPQDPDRVFLANDGGLFLSHDRGETWLHLNNLPIGEFYTLHLEERESPFQIYGGTQDNASHVGPSTAQLVDTREDDWTQVFLDRWGGGDGFVTLPDPTDPGWVYYEHQHGDMYRKKLGGSPLTGAKGDKRIRPRAKRGEQPYRFGWHTPFILSHHDATTLYVGGNKLLKSVDRGDNWTEISPEFSQPSELGNRSRAPLGVITSIAESRIQKGLIYVGLDNGEVHRTDDDGLTWTKCSEGLPDKWVSHVEASRHELGTVYVSHTGYREDDFTTYLHQSTDNGESWIDVASNLPAASVNVVREDSLSGDVLYLGNDLGVYTSTDRGQSWKSLCTSLPTTSVHDLAIHPIEHKLVIATHGRSMFALDAKTIVADKPAETVVAASRSSQTHADRLVESANLRALGPMFKPGRIAEIAVDPNHRSTWYLAHGSGGLWKTTNAGTTWKPIFDQGGSYSLGYVTVDAQNPEIVWLGTGENISNRSVGYGDGIYKSLDGGETWTNVGLRDSQHIGKILINPRDSRVVYVAAEGPLWSAGGDRGLYKTIDGGATWQAVLRISEDTGVTDIVMDPRDPNVIYASSFQRRRRVGQLIGGGPESAIYKTTDGGATWKKLSNGIPSVDKGRIALTVSPQNPDIVYALITAAGDQGGFFRSADRGETWVRQSNYRVIDPQYYGEIYADPHHFDRIYAMDVRIQVSENGGKTFRPLRWNMHVDNHAMVFDPSDPDHLLVGNDGGLYESFDSGQTWRHFTNLPTSQFYRVAVDDVKPFYNVYGGTQDNGSMAGPSRTINRIGIRTSEWIQTRGGDGFQTRIDPNDSNTIYTLSQNGDLGRLDKRTGKSKGIRPRLPRTEVSNTEASKTEDRVRWHWDSPLIISPHSATRLYFAGSRLFRSDDRGDTWQPVSDDLTRQLDRDTMPIMGRQWGDDAVQKNRFTTELSVITALEESHLKEGLLVVGTDDGLLQITENGGDSWQRIESFPDAPDGTYVSDVCLSQHRPGRIYVSLNNHKRGDFQPYLFRSDDLGKTWQSITATLPDRHVVWCVLEDPINLDLLFVGTEFGLFCTHNGGEHWIPIKNGAPPVAFRDLVIHPREHDLVAATFGRGFYILDDITALQHLDAATLDQSEAQVIPPRDAWVYDEIGYVEAVYGDETMPNPAYGSSLCYFLRDSLSEGRVEISIESADGTLVRSLPGRNTSGFHRLQWDLRGRSAIGNGRRRQGALVSPGKYTVKLIHTVGDQQTVLGDTQTLHVNALPTTR